MRSLSGRSAPCAAWASPRIIAKAWPPSSKSAPRPSPAAEGCNSPRVPFVALGKQPQERVVSLIIVIILILLLIGAVPRWGYSRGWGYGPSGILGVILIIVVILLLMGRL